MGRTSNGLKCQMCSLNCYEKRLVIIITNHELNMNNTKHLSVSSLYVVLYLDGAFVPICNIP